MTLSKFKQRLKIGFLVALALFYALSFYSLGKYGAGNVLKVKGAQTEANGQDAQKNRLENPLPYADVQSAKIVSQSVKLCSNTYFGFEIAYPSDWFTTYSDQEHQCRFFAPYAFVIPETHHQSFVPVEVQALSLEEWAPTVKFFENPNEFYNVVTTETVEVEGKVVKRIESTSAGAGAIPRGYAQLVYLIFDSQKPLQIKYQQLEETEKIENSKTALEGMVRSIKYF